MTYYGIFFFFSFLYSFLFLRTNKPRNQKTKSPPPRKKKKMVLANCGLGLTTLGFVLTLRVIWILTFIVLHPFVIHVINFQLDSMDFDVSVHIGLSRDTYDRIDKVADLAYYLGALLYLLVHLEDLWYAKYTVPFLAYRMVGNLIFIGTLDNFILIIFANVFQLLFFLYTFLDLIQYDAYLRDTQYLNAVIIAIVTAIKFVWEGFMHGDQNKENPADDESVCRCENAWDWLADRVVLLGIALLFALYIGFIRVANYNPPRPAPFSLKQEGWDRVPAGGSDPEKSPFNLNPIVSVKKKTNKIKI